MPVPAQVGCVLWDDHQMESANGDHAFASRTAVGLGSRSGLHVTNAQPPRNAHATKAAVRTSAPTTMAMSAARCCCFRNGLNPMLRCYRRKAGLPTYGKMPDRAGPAPSSRIQDPTSSHRPPTIYSGHPTVPLDPDSVGADHDRDEIHPADPYGTGHPSHPARLAVREVPSRVIPDRVAS